ncbi:MAG: hypothetical protein ABL994_05490 [Verrucomicrobiales bacterium]
MRNFTASIVRCGAHPQLFDKTAAERHKLEENIARHKAEIAFWGRHSIVKNGVPQGSLPEGICHRLAELQGLIAVDELRLKRLRLRRLRLRRLSTAP